jgi:hypothetical protein
MTTTADRPPRLSELRSLIYELLAPAAEISGRHERL